MNQLPERDHTAPAEEQGLFRKFEVRRTDGSSEPGRKHARCENFVLDVDHDPHAKAALAAYADRVESSHPLLARDMRKRYGLQPAPRDLATLVLELAEAVDSAVADIGGSRPQLTILREAVVEAVRIKAAA